MKVPVSNRMKLSADILEPAQTVADIGCDHAYTSMYMIETGKAKKVLAMDINEGPLATAKKNISNYGYERQIETRLSNGMEKLQAGEVDSVLIGGMGGVLICQILTEGKTLLSGMKQLVLQPQSEVGLVRKFLHENGFFIEKEVMVLEDGKYYVIIRAIPGHECYEQEWEYKYGKYLFEKNDELFFDFLAKRYESKKKILAGLLEKKTSNSRTTEKIKALQEELTVLKTLRGNHHG